MHVCMYVCSSVYEGVHGVQLLELCYSALSLLLHSFSLSWLGELSRSRQGHASTFDLYYALVLTRVAALVPLCALHPDTPRALANGSWHSLIFVGYMAGMLLSGAALHFLVDVMALRSSALTATLIHSARGLAMPIIHLL